MTKRISKTKMNQFFWTIIYLKASQIIYRIYYRLKRFKSVNDKLIYHYRPSIIFHNHIKHRKSLIRPFKFEFLNQEFEFLSGINWNHSNNGKLWAYNLNYFDFLIQENISKHDGLLLIEDFIKKYPDIKEGKDPYPISLRTINWIKFITLNKIKCKSIDKHLFLEVNLLSKNIEYHILGNHILENGFSLLFGAYYFKEHRFYKKAKKIISKELDRQILQDGGHFELSPMYHNILLHRVLDSINLIRLNDWKKDELLIILEKKAELMISWISKIGFKNGDIPMVNDSAYNISPGTKELLEYAEVLEIKKKDVHLRDSGYRKLLLQNFELFIDVGGIKANYQPGHSHSDIFNFILYKDNKPLIVDVGVSTYNDNQRRYFERSTAAHNTICIENINPIEVWSSFRVGKRAKVNIHSESNHHVSASHNGYKHLGITHIREFSKKENSFIILDKLVGKKDKLATALIHFHPSLKNIKLDKNKVFIESAGFNLEIEGGIKEISLEPYEIASGFNLLQEAKCLKVDFINQIQTSIH